MNHSFVIFALSDTTGEGLWHAMEPSLSDKLKKQMETQYADDVLLWGRWTDALAPDVALPTMSRCVLAETMGTVQLVWHVWQDAALSWEKLWFYMDEKKRRPLALGVPDWSPKEDVSLAETKSARTVSISLPPAEVPWRQWAVPDALTEASHCLSFFKGADVASAVTVRSTHKQDFLFRQALLLTEKMPMLALRLDKLGGEVAKYPGLMVGCECFSWHDAHIFMEWWDNLGVLRDIDPALLYPLARMLNRGELSLDLFEWAMAMDALDAPVPIKKRLQDALRDPSVRRIVASVLWWLNDEEEYNG